MYTSRTLLITTVVLVASTRQNTWNYAQLTVGPQQHFGVKVSKIRVNLPRKRANTEIVAVEMFVVFSFFPETILFSKGWTAAAPAFHTYVRGSGTEREREGGGGVYLVLMCIRYSNTNFREHFNGLAEVPLFLFSSFLTWQKEKKKVILYY